MRGVRVKVRSGHPLQFGHRLFPRPGRLVWPLTCQRVLHVHSRKSPGQQRHPTHVPLPCCGWVARCPPALPSRRGSLSSADSAANCSTLTPGTENVSVTSTTTEEVLEVALADLSGKRRLAVSGTPAVVTPTRATGEHHRWGRRNHPGACRALFRHSFLSRLAVSTTASTASAPLLPALVPARSMACSRVSVVSTPKATGTPVSRLTRAMPEAAFPATKS